MVKWHKDKGEYKGEIVHVREYQGVGVGLAGYVRKDGGFVWQGVDIMEGCNCR